MRLTETFKGHKSPATCDAFHWHVEQSQMCLLENGIRGTQKSSNHVVAFAERTEAGDPHA
jgi:hypothetical protein